ncbi:hypothetical protein F383_37343 [Gossypium arboreum]|uniref:Uncharacterized protein n=1 Tax=Gossypium arboreum TaxID=29729 RepID=A0A0B0MGK5_GOSAR|nr:uncharacterized protein LOC108472678 [Gossypium arboreum]KHF98045.1 hypothetical protein F383_37343 [Gossypium arboreum]
MMNGDPRVSLCLLISILAPWSVNFSLETSSNFDAGEDEGFRWLLHEGTGVCAGVRGAGVAPGGVYGAMRWGTEARGCCSARNGDDLGFLKPVKEMGLLGLFL